MDLTTLLAIIYNLIAVITPAIIYWDAARNKIGRVNEVKSFWNIPAGWWGACAVLIWIITVIGYLVKRKELIERAKIYPRESKYKALKIIALVTFAIASILITNKSAERKLHQQTPAAITQSN